MTMNDAAEQRGGESPDVFTDGLHIGNTQIDVGNKT
jgi:hypothetical protein